MSHYKDSRNNRVSDGTYNTLARVARLFLFLAFAAICILGVTTVLW